MKKTLWLIGLIVIVSLIFGTFFVVVQQVLRMGANDPQIELAEDTGNLLNNGVSTSTYSSVPKVNVATSIAPFVMIYDNKQQLQASTAALNGAAPELPVGVLENTGFGHENRRTWQPRTGVRLAIVTVKTNNGYVVAGRSLREVEQRERDALYQIIIGWLMTVGFILTWAWISPRINLRRHG